MKESSNSEFFPEKDGPAMSLQGLTGKNDFPTVIVRVHDDAGELQAADDWDKWRRIKKETIIFQKRIIIKNIINVITP